MNFSADKALVTAVRSRGQKQTEHNYGILTADRYLKTLLECVGHDLCNRFCAKGNVSFNDQLKRSESRLTYNNPEMVIEDIFGEFKKEFSLKDTFGQEVELPKNTLMVFKHILTSPKKDRDGDILRTQGAVIDPKMLLLWQHNHTLPIGKMLGIVSHTAKNLSVMSCIVDMNELSHDAAVMIDNKMGRFSHGFRALDFSENKESEDFGEPTGPGGFDVKRFEIMEESVVSVPSNTDAEVEDVFLSLVSGGKLTSPLMKAQGKKLFEKQPKSFNIGFENERKSKEESCTCGKSHTSEETDENHGEEKKSDGEEMKTCPKCKAPMKDGVCTKCGYKKAVDEAVVEVVEVTVKEAMSVILTKATSEERSSFIKTLQTVQDSEQTKRRSEQFKQLIGR